MANGVGGLGSATSLLSGAGGGLLAGLGPAALFAFAPSLLSHFFGGNAQKKYRQQVSALYSPQNIANTTNQFYRQQVSSPAFSQAQGTIAAGANQTSQNLAQALAARGLGTSGAGAILSSAVPSIVGSQQAGLRTAAYGAAQQQTMQKIQAQLAALQGTQGPSQTQQLFAGGLESFGPFLQAYLKSKYPQMFGGMA